MNTFEKDGQYIAHTYARFPLQIVSGKGSILTDSEGKEYIDLGTGIAVNTFGRPMKNGFKPLPNS